ncbi:MAG: amino acid permease [Flavobacteriales bacterium]|nr:amino acid permease [Flavobacteriales bacterium]MBL0044063.1 amino acid permease [Flavobacteriales bacterium]
MLASLFRKKPIASALKQHEPVVGHPTPDSEDHSGSVSGTGMHRTLGVRDLTFFGIAAIIGAGSFSSMGTACASGGPGVVLLFVMCGIACGFTALCYAEFASRVPVSGSAYTYAYVSFGEVFAWIIGWALLMEYSIGNIYVAFSWSGYFTNLLDSVVVGGKHILHLPEWLTVNYTSAHATAIAGTAGEGSKAWNSAPMLGSLRIIFDLPAVLINILITAVVYVGVKESRNASNIMVMIKLAIIALVIIVGATHIDIDNWTPFLPKGFGGVMAGVSAVFFAYIGFDAVSTLAEESKDPQRDLPRSMMWSLVICTGLYILLALVLTGMVPFSQLGVSDPLAEVFQLTGVKWMLLIVSIAAVVAMTSVMLVFQLGQPRIWMSMSRDGLLPPRFGHLHRKYQTPGFSTIVTGLVVGIPIFFTDESFILDFTSIGTLFAFVLVCGGVLMLPKRDKAPGRFHLTYINAKFIVPFMALAGLALLVWLDPNHFHRILGRTGFPPNVPLAVFYVLCAVVAFYSFQKEWSLIPVLGLMSCCYLLTGMAVSNWTWFSIWLVVGLICYFAYGYRKSKLAQG